MGRWIEVIGGLEAGQRNTTKQKLEIQNILLLVLVLRVAGQSNPSKSVRVRRQAFLGQGRLTIFSLAISFDFQTLVPSSHLIFRF